MKKSADIASNRENMTLVTIFAKIASIPTGDKRLKS